MVNLADYQRPEQPNWCPGCGDLAIWQGVKRAGVELDLPPHEVVLVSGVGCFAKLPYWVKAYGFVGLHGRVLPLAQGIKLANPRLKVIALGGDGDGYGEGGNHLLHACRRNVDLAYFVHNNEVFALTTGQHSPTAEKGTRTKSSPAGSEERPFNPLAVALAAGATFVARAYAGNLPELVRIMKEAIQHPGFALVDILQPCLTFGKDYSYYNQKVYSLREPFKDKAQALAKILEDEKEGRLASGVFWKE